LQQPRGLGHDIGGLGIAQHGIAATAGQERRKRRNDRQPNAGPLRPPGDFGGVGAHQFVNQGRPAAIVVAVMAMNVNGGQFFGGPGAIWHHKEGAAGMPQCRTQSRRQNRAGGP